MTRARTRRNASFTLVEMLAAITVAAVILPVALQGISLAVSATGQARQRLEATSLAQSKLAELVTTGAWQSGELSGDFGEEWPAYSWAAEVSTYPTGAGLQELDLTVSWKSRGRDYSIELNTLVYTGGGSASGGG